MATGKFILPVGGSSQPDPASYCPTNGYIPDPSIYITPGYIANMPDPVTDEIILLVLEGYERYVAFSVTVSGTSQSYNTKVYNSSNILVLNFNTASGSAAKIPLIYGQEPYIIRITPVNATYHLTSFGTQTSYGYVCDWYIIAAKFKTPYFTSLASMFYNNTRLMYCKFFGAMDLLTSMSSTFYNCIELQTVIMPTSMALNTTLYMTFMLTPKLVRCDLPGMPELTTFQYAFYSSGIFEVTVNGTLPKCKDFGQAFQSTLRLVRFVFPSSMPELTNLGSTFASSSVKYITWPLTAPKVTTLSNVCASCTELVGDQLLPQMPLNTSLSASFNLCRKITKLTIQGPMPLCIAMSGFASSCWELTELKFPDSLGITNSSNAMTACDAMYKCVKITLPNAMYKTVDDTYAFLTGMSNNFQVAEMTTCNLWPAIPVMITMTAMKNVVTFNQPTLKVRGLTLQAYGSNGVKGKLEYVEIDWENSSFNYGGIQLSDQNIGTAEFNRIMARLPRLTSAITITGTFSGQNPCWTDGTGSQGIQVLNSYVVNVNVGTASRVQVGMEIWGDYISGLAKTSHFLVSFDGTTDIATLNTHGYSNGQKVSFCVITTTTGILVNTPYYLINVTTNTFQLSATVGGPAIDLVGNGTGQLIVFGVVTQLIDNYNFRISIPWKLAGTQTFRCGFITPSLGFHKGWRIQ